MKSFFSNYVDFTAKTSSNFIKTVDVLYLLNINLWLFFILHFFSREAFGEIPNRL